MASAVLVSAGVMAAFYLVTLGAWEALGETYKDVDVIDVPSDGYGDAHVLYDVGVGAAHMAWRRLGGIGVGLTVVWLINAPLQIFATSDWSDAIGTIVFLFLLAWVFALSVVLVISLRRTAVVAPASLAQG